MHDPREVAAALAARLIERRDVKAIQTANGGYMPHRDGKDGPYIPWRGRDLVAHLDGDKTYGHYVVDPTADTCRVFCFDIDLRKKARTQDPWNEPPVMFDDEEIDPREVWHGANNPCRVDLALQLRAMAQGLAEKVRDILDITPLVTYSGNKGMHVYGLLDPGTPASESRELALAVIAATEGDIIPEHGDNFFMHATGYKALQIEVFPKQSEVSASGFGNLLRLPLGIHQKTRKPSYVVDLRDPKRMRIDENILEALKGGTFRG